MIAQILEQHCEIASTLWLRRDASLSSGILLLADLERLDERIEAQIDGLRIAGDAACGACHDALVEPGGLDGSAFFAAGVHAVDTGGPPAFEALTQKLQAPQPTAVIDPKRALVSALAWADPAQAAAVRSWLLRAEDPMQRWLGVAAVGASRAARHFDWHDALSDPDAIVRGRACRTLGELGRRELAPALAPGLADEDPVCRFWSAWAAARIGGGEEALAALAEIAWTGKPHADQALDLLLRRLDVAHANAWLRAFATLPGRQRSLIRAAGVVGDPIYVPWLIERMAEAETARLAGEAFCMITGLDLANAGLVREAPRDFQSGPTDNAADPDVAIDEDDGLPWPDPGQVGSWWLANIARFAQGVPYFLGAPKPVADWLSALARGTQRQRQAAALEIAIRQPHAAMFEVRARGQLQRRLITRSRGPGGGNNSC